MPEQPRTFGQPDNRSTGERLADLRSVQRQALSVMVGREDAALNQRLLSMVERRREERDDPVKFGEIPDRRGGSTLAKVAELLVRTDSVGNIDRLLRLYRLEAEPIPGLLDGRVTRLKGPDQGLKELAALAATLRRQGVAISANDMTPLGPASKCVAGPELSSAGEGPKSPVAKRSRLSRKPPSEWRS